MFSAANTEIFATCVLAAMGLGLAWHGIVLLRRSPFTLLQGLFFVVNLWLARVLWRTQVIGAVPLMQGKGGVIVCNHRCSVDPAFIYLATKSVVHWMVAKEYCVHPTMAWFFRAIECIPVSRGGIDTSATKAAIQYARNGGLVGLFPEGRINNTDQLLLPGRPGAAMIALKARVPVIPCFLSGSPYDGTIFGSFFMPAKVRLEVGRPIDLSEYYGHEKDRAVLEGITRRFLAEIARLAGHSNYRPQLAGRFYKPGVV